MEVPPLSAMRASWMLKWAIMHAECAGMSGPGYYAAGPLLDVQDVPAKSQASFRSVGVTGLGEPEVGSARTKHKELPVRSPEQMALLMESRETSRAR